MRFVGGPLHGQDRLVNDSTILYRSADAEEGTITYRLRRFGARREPGGWMLEVMVAPDLDRHEGDGQLLAHMLDAFIQDLPGARRVGDNTEQA